MFSVQTTMKQTLVPTRVNAGITSCPPACLLPLPRGVTLPGLSPVRAGLSCQLPVPGATGNRQHSLCRCHAQPQKVEVWSAEPSGDCMREYRWKGLDLD